MRDQESHGGRCERGEDDRQQEVAAQDFVERAAVDRDEKHRRQGEGIDELIERRAGGLGHQPEAPGEVAARDQPEDRQDRAENRV